MEEFGVSMTDAHSDMLKMGDPYSVFKVSLLKHTSHLFVLSPECFFYSGGKVSSHA